MRCGACEAWKACEAWEACELCEAPISTCSIRTLRNKQPAGTSCACFAALCTKKQAVPSSKRKERSNLKKEKEKKPPKTAKKRSNPDGGASTGERFTPASSVMIGGVDGGGGGGCGRAGVQKRTQRDGVAGAAWGIESARVARREKDAYLSGAVFCRRFRRLRGFWALPPGGCHQTLFFWFRPPSRKTDGEQFANVVDTLLLIIVNNFCCDVVLHLPHLSSNSVGDSPIPALFERLGGIRDYCLRIAHVLSLCLGVALRNV